MTPHHEGNLTVRSMKRFALLLALFTLIACEGDSGPTGPEGPAGSQGPIGSQGPGGPPGVSNLGIVSASATIPGATPSDTIPGQIQLTVRVDCPTGKKIMGGGYSSTGDRPDAVQVYRSFPSDDASWSITANNSYVGPSTITAFAICAVVS